MNQKNISEFKPFVSIIIIIFVLFSMVFIKIELRSLGYTVLKKIRVYRSLQDNYYLQKIDYAKVISSDNLRRLAKSKLTLSEVEYGQIIQMAGENIAIRQ